MTLIKYKNFSKELPSGIKDGDRFEYCNFSQIIPNTKIFVGIKNLTFYKCNLVNCIPPNDAKAEGCNTAQIERCSHLYPKWNLSVCSENCSHVVNIDNITIDGKIIDTIYIREDKKIGKWKPSIIKPIDDREIKEL